MDQTIEVRPGEDFDREAMRQFLIRNIPDFPADEELVVRQFPSGASNLTYLLMCGHWEGVMRRPPFGPLPPKAHDMKRESELLRRIYPSFPLVPKVYAFTDDESIIGAPFYVMERKKGLVVDRGAPFLDKLSPEEFRRISLMVADTMVDLHAVDYQAAGLQEFGRPEGFVERQVKGWVGRYQRAKTDDIPAEEKLSKWFLENVPPSVDTTIVHNDFKFNNMLFAEDFSRVTAVVDWEMSTIGDPLFDLGVTLSYWTQADDDELLRTALPAVNMTPGCITREEYVQHYAKKTGRDVTHINYYVTFGYYKLAVVMQQIYYRWKLGKTQDPRFANFGDTVQKLMSYALKQVESPSL